MTPFKPTLDSEEVRRLYANRAYKAALRGREAALVGDKARALYWLGRAEDLKNHIN